MKSILSVRTDFSLGDSIVKIGDLVAKAKSLGYTHIGITDSMTLSGLIALSKACKKHDITPILGCVISVYQDPTYRKPSKASGEAEKFNPRMDLKV